MVLFLLVFQQWNVLINKVVLKLKNKVRPQLKTPKKYFHLREINFIIIIINWEEKLSFSTETFLQQLWRHKKRKLIVETYSSVGKRANSVPDFTVKITLLG